MTTPNPTLTATKTGFIVVVFLLAVSACSASSGADAEQLTDEIRLVVDETPIVAGSQTQIGSSTQVAFEEFDTRGEDPFDADADIAECRPQELIALFDAEPVIAAAWAEAAGVETSEITETILSYTAITLEVDTRVTNHAYRGGVVRGFQATLEAGTAVLVDAAGVPRVRCACGNPLAPPQPVVDEVPEAPTQVPVTTTTVVISEVPAAAPIDFCTTWQVVQPGMLGGPSGSGTEEMAEYLNGLVDGFDELIAAATATSGFPADALADLTAYRNALATAALTGDLSPGPDDALVGMRVEEFLTSYCGGGFEDSTPDVPTHVSTDDTDDAHDQGDDDSASEGSTGNCGSMQFALLIMVAEDLGIDYLATSQPYVDAMNALVNGFDPGPEFDVSDLSLMIANEEIGCQGAQAMQQLIIAAGYGPLIEGTELGA